MIDMHSHFFPSITRAQAQSVDSERAPWLSVDPDGRSGKIMLGDKPFRPVNRVLREAHARVAELDAMGVQPQIVWATPVMFGYAWEAARAADWAAHMNQQALAFCAAHPARRKALAQVPLQDLKLACAEATRATAAGCVGVQIGNHVGPSSYARRFHVDSAVFSAGALRLLTDVMGVDRVMLGSDYPFPLGEQRIGQLIADAAAFNAADRQRMRRSNAEAFFSL